MNEIDTEHITQFFNEVKNRKNLRRVTADDLKRLQQISVISSKPPCLQRQFTDLLNSMKPGDCIQSRLDSHHWDLGLCNIESWGDEILCAVDGYVFCLSHTDQGNEFPTLYFPEEVRKIGGAIN